MDLPGTEYAKIWVEDGIGRVEFFERDDIDYVHAREYVERCIKLSGYKLMPVLIDARGLKNITPQAVQYLAGEEAKKITKAAAILINPMNPVVSVVVSVFLKLKSDPLPIKFFNDKQKALEWLKQFVEIVRIN